MSNKRSSDLDALLDEILTDAEGDDEQLCALQQTLELNVKVPSAASIAGEPVMVTRFDYDGNARRGLTATIRRPDGSKHVIAAADISLADTASHRYVEAYRRWMGVAPSIPTPPPAKKFAPLETEVSSASIDVVILSLSARAVLCKTLNSGELVTIRTGKHWQVVPGEIVTIKPVKRWTYGGAPYLSGSVESTQLDAKQIGLTPLKLQSYGQWDPAEEFWGDPGDPIPAWAKKIIKCGRRPQFEMEQVFPEEGPEVTMSDPIIDSIDRKNAGDHSGAYDILMRLCRADLRCLDAHAHLGNLSFDTRPKHAIRNYEVGVRIGELSLPSNFNGVLLWRMIDNRPFLRCLYSFGLCLWRLERFEESLAVFERILWMNPPDNQGARFVIDDVRKRRAWRSDD